jgi:hypothetical protein
LSKVAAYRATLARSSSVTLIVETLLFSGENVGSAYLFTSQYEPGVDRPDWCPVNWVDLAGHR